jgi:nicotinamide riboside transporter PnuC
MLGLRTTLAVSSGFLSLVTTLLYGFMMNPYLVYAWKQTVFLASQAVIITRSQPYTAGGNVYS